MNLYNAVRKLAKRKMSRSYYNSDYILTIKEKQVLLTSGFILIFPIIIIAVLILTN